MEIIAALFCLAELAAAVSCLYHGTKARKLCLAALWGNGIILVLSLVPLVFILNEMQHTSEAGFALGFVRVLPVPPLLAFVVFAGIYYWRVRSRRRDK
jgi:hypothetical protein